jgi:hypothetical protein
VAAYIIRFPENLGFSRDRHSSSSTRHESRERKQRNRAWRWHRRWLKHQFDTVFLAKTCFANFKLHSCGNQEASIDRSRRTTAAAETTWSAAA